MEGEERKRGLPHSQGTFGFQRLQSVAAVRKIGHCPPGTPVLILGLHQRQADRRDKEWAMLKTATALLMALVLPLCATEPITMHMHVSSEVAYKTLEKLSGERIILPQDLGSEKVQIDVDHATFEEALDEMAAATHTWWRIQVKQSNDGAESRVIVVEQIR